MCRRIFDRVICYRRRSLQSTTTPHLDHRVQLSNAARHAFQPIGRTTSHHTHQRRRWLGLVEAVRWHGRSDATGWHMLHHSRRGRRERRCREEEDENDAPMGSPITSPAGVDVFPEAKCVKHGLPYRRPTNLSNSYRSFRAVIQITRIVFPLGHPFRDRFSSLL
jgi:hypothetical protein